MSGALWILSYLILSLTVLVLTLGVVGLYRSSPRGLVKGPQRWPLPGLPPGTVLPFARDADGFLVFTAGEPEGHSASLAAAAVAEAWHEGARIIFPAETPPEWMHLVPRGIPMESQGLAQPSFDSLRLERTPVVAFSQRGRVVEATSLILAAPELARHFRMAAAPLFPDDVPLSPKAARIADPLEKSAAALKYRFAGRSSSIHSEVEKR
jgi:hypothetical protein